MDFITIININTEVYKVCIYNTKILNILNNNNYLDLVVLDDNIKIYFNDKQLEINKNELYEIYSYGIKTLFTLTFEEINYFIFIDIVRFYKLYFIKGFYIHKKNH